MILARYFIHVWIGVQRCEARRWEHSKCTRPGVQRREARHWKHSKCTRPGVGLSDSDDDDDDDDGDDKVKEVVDNDRQAGRGRWMESLEWWAFRWIENLDVNVNICTCITGWCSMYNQDESCSTSCTWVNMWFCAYTIMVMHNLTLNLNFIWGEEWLFTQLDDICQSYSKV